MKIVFHKKFLSSDYAPDPAAARVRLDSILSIVSSRPDRYDVIQPSPASEEDILRAHSSAHYRRIRRDQRLYELASLAAGGAILAAEQAYLGSPSFAVLQPPGHHASGDSCWGFCFFNNLGVSLLKLYFEKKIASAFVLDFDLHTGDGNIEVLQGGRDGFRVSILNPQSNNRKAYVAEVEACMRELQNVDIFAASAGFDQGVGDWGDLLHPEDYTELGRLMKEYSDKICKGRRFALLEGGYNHDMLGKNLDAFCQGFGTD